MSELIEGLPPPPPVARTRDAAAVILFRKVQRPAEPKRSAPPPTAEAFWLKREAKLAFAGGFYAFPGGKVDKADASVPVEGATGLDATLRVTAARELLEETGVLVAHGPTLARADVDAMRKALLDETASFGALLEKHGLKLRAADFVDAGRWVTPPHLPVRFDARFFLVEAPEGSNAVVWPGELTEGEWIAPNPALTRWSNGTALLHPPNLHALQSLVAYRGDTAPVLKNLRAPTQVTDFIARRIEFQMGIRIFPLRTPTLPPAAHTNCYVVGNSDLLIVDPGSPDDEETDRLLSFVRELMTDGYKPRAVVLTHHHGDHVGGAARVMKELNLPLWCHAVTAERLPELNAARLLNDNELIPLGGIDLIVHHTPGHARGHICLEHKASHAMIVGDMVAGVGTIVIDPPEGDMGEYLRQLQRLKDLGARTLYPAHGPPLPDGPAKLDEYLNHRAWREGKVVAALTEELQSLEQLVPKAYDDVQSFVLPLAERNTVAILDKLIAEGRARRDGEKYGVR
ncbi:MAG: MBL fold metallo-hydrolase [Myxococcaceae bacterium]|nr:MBL fold metallo-hydrolase [Myxococcaceae bacterium]